jgi:hypothetical protein
MFPIRWSQPPWRNIELSGVYQTEVSPSTQRVPGASSTTWPAGASPSSSAGIRPSSQTESSRGSGAPRPWSRVQLAAFAAIRPRVTSGVRICGLSSRIGNIPGSVPGGCVGSR